MNAQLPLALRWPAHQRFATFVPGGNAGAVELLRAAAEHAEPATLLLVAASGTGRTHLLIAACAAAGECGRSAQYVPLRSLAAPRAAAIRGFGGSDLLAVDDLSAIVGDADAEHALFDLYNRCRAEHATLLFAAGAPAAQLGLALPDLVSRLSACAQVALKPLDEAARRSLLRGRATMRGIELDDGALDWLFARGQRDPASLLAALDRIDAASLAAQRRVTIPFLRDLLGEAGAERRRE